MRSPPGRAAERRGRLLVDGLLGRSGDPLRDEGDGAFVQRGRAVRFHLGRAEHLDEHPSGLVDADLDHIRAVEPASQGFERLT